MFQRACMPPPGGVAEAASERRHWLRALACVWIASKYAMRTNLPSFNAISWGREYLRFRQVQEDVCLGFEVYEAHDLQCCEVQLLTSMQVCFSVHEQLPLWSWQLEPCIASPGNGLGAPGCACAGRWRFPANGGAYRNEWR
eukprot:gene25662-49782_t